MSMIIDLERFNVVVAQAVIRSGGCTREEVEELAIAGARNRPKNAVMSEQEYVFRIRNVLMVTWRDMKRFEGRKKKEQNWKKLRKRRKGW